jgi:hypothetical protein
MAELLLHRKLLFSEFEVVVGKLVRRVADVLLAPLGELVGGGLLSELRLPLGGGGGLLEIRDDLRGV